MIKNTCTNWIIDHTNNIILFKNLIIINMSLNFKDYAKLVLSRTQLRNPFNKVFKVIEFETTSYCNRKCSYWF